MLIADTHVHFYPAYDVAVALDCAYQRLLTLSGRSSGVDAALLLTERHDCFFFRELACGKRSLPAGYSCHPGPETGSLMISRTGGSSRLWLMAGRQIVTSDGIEVLALLTASEFPDRQDTRETIAQIRAAGGIPVLSWAPGKWLGRRGSIVRNLVDEAGDELLVLGDTSLRPRCWPTPRLIQHGRNLGLPVLAGSDPLPFAGDETSTGCYAVRFDAFDPEKPVGSIRSAVIHKQFSVVGRRDPLPRMLARWIKNQRVRKAAA